MENVSTADAKALKPQQAKIVFDQLAKQIHAEDGSRDFVAAWAKAKFLRPDLAARMTEAPPALDNESLFARNAFYTTMMGLPSNISANEFAVAWRANGNAPTPVNSTAMFDALTGFTMASQKLSSVAEAQKATAQKYPGLARAAGYVMEAA